MEALLKRLVEERQVGNNQEVQLDVRLYNLLLKSWAAVAPLHHHHPAETAASQRARQILVSLQENYEQQSNDQQQHAQKQQQLLQPDAESFDIVLHLVCQTEGAVIARRLLAWMEYLDKSGKNPAAKPTKEQYVTILDTYANNSSGDPNAGVLAEAFMRHMEITAGIEPDTVCYNIAIKSLQ